MRPVKVPHAIISVSIADNIVVNIDVLQRIRMSAVIVEYKLGFIRRPHNHKNSATTAHIKPNSKAN